MNPIIFIVAFAVVIFAAYITNRMHASDAVRNENEIM